MAHVRLSCVTLGSLVLLACGGEPKPPPAPAPAMSRPAVAATTTPRVRPEPDKPALEAFPTPAGEPKYKRVLSKRLRLSVPLPNRSGWAMKREKSSFLILDHEATSSRLLVGLWREDELMNRDKCETRARLLRELPNGDEGVLSTRDVAVPEGFDTRVRVGFDTTGEGAPLDGWVVAFGGRARECFAFIYTTTSTGDGAERIVGDRLAVMQTLSLEGVERRLGAPIGREKPADAP